MNKIVKTLVALSAVSVYATSFAATITSYDSPVNPQDKAVNEALAQTYKTYKGDLNRVDFNVGKKVDLQTAFGMPFDQSQYYLKVVVLGKNFGIEGQDLDVNNAFFVGDNRVLVSDGHEGYTGFESYIEYGANEQVSLSFYSNFVNKSYDIFSTEAPAFSWKVIDSAIFYADMGYTNKQIADMLGRTLILGFEDSLGAPAWFDFDYNDVIVAIQMVAKDTSVPQGQPLPGVLATIFLGAAGIPFVRRKFKRK